MLPHEYLIQNKEAEVDVMGTSLTRAMRIVEIVREFLPAFIFWVLLITKVMDVYTRCNRD